MAEATGGRRGRLLVFVHVPKTAGTTLRTVLSRNEPGMRSQALANVFKGGGGISKGLIERLRNGKGPELGGVGLVRGHFPLGIREYLPKHRDLHCFTLLREPADRTLSHYFQIRETHAGSDRGGKYALSPLPADATVDDALERGYIHDNLHTRMLSGDPEPFGEVTDEMLERAKHNLREELAFFGLTERFDESLVLAKQRLGLRSILYRSSSSARPFSPSSGRMNTKRPRGDDVPEELARAAERSNHYDIELYRYAQELFDNAPERGELEFEVELAALRAAKGDGEIELAAPIPDGFGGDEQAWRMLLQARVTAQRLERELGGTGIEAASERATVRDLRQQVERLEAVPSTTKELREEVHRLTDAASRAEELEQEVERLQAASSRVKELEQEVGRLEAAAGRHDARRGAPRRARARPKRGTARPTRARKPRNSKQRGAPRAKPRTSGRRAGSDRSGDGADA